MFPQKLKGNITLSQNTCRKVALKFREIPPGGILLHSKLLTHEIDPRNARIGTKKPNVLRAFREAGLETRKTNLTHDHCFGRQVRFPLLTSPLEPLTVEARVTGIALP